MFLSSKGISWAKILNLYLDTYELIQLVEPQFLNCVQTMHSKTNSMQLMLVKVGVQFNITYMCIHINSFTMTWKYESKWGIHVDKDMATH